MAPVLEGKAPIPAIATTGAGKGEKPRESYTSKPVANWRIFERGMDRRPGMVFRMAWLFFYAKIQDGLKNLWMLLDLQVFGKKVVSAGLFRVFGTKYPSEAFSISVLFDHFVSAQALLACCQPSLCLGACGDTEAVVPGGELFSLTQESPKLAFIQVIRSWKKSQSSRKQEIVCFQLEKARFFFGSMDVQFAPLSALEKVQKAA